MSTGQVEAFTQHLTSSCWALTHPRRASYIFQMEPAASSGASRSFLNKLTIPFFQSISILFCHFWMCRKKHFNFSGWVVINSGQVVAHPNSFLYRRYHCKQIFIFNVSKSRCRQNKFVSTPLCRPICTTYSNLTFKRFCFFELPSTFAAYSS